MSIEPGATEEMAADVPPQPLDDDTDVDEDPHITHDECMQWIKDSVARYRTRLDDLRVELGRMNELRQRERYGDKQIIQALLVENRNLKEQVERLTAVTTGVVNNPLLENRIRDVIESHQISQQELAERRRQRHQQRPANAHSVNQRLVRRSGFGVRFDEQS